jgi:hypothetical protein
MTDSSPGLHRPISHRTEKILNQHSPHSDDDHGGFEQQFITDGGARRYLNCGRGDCRITGRSSVWKNPLLTVEATRWLYDRGSRMHGVEGPSTDKPTDKIVAQHRLCREVGISHWE